MITIFQGCRTNMSEFLRAVTIRLLTCLHMAPVHCVLVLQIINTRLGQLRVKTVPSMAITVKMH